MLYIVNEIKNKKISFCWIIILSLLYSKFTLRTNKIIESKNFILIAKFLTRLFKNWHIKYFLSLHTHTHNL